MSEPITTLTDYAIALECLLFAGLLGCQLQPSVRAPSVTLWAIAFVCTAVAAGLGGTLHGFLALLHTAVATVFWHAMLLSVGLASCAMLLGVGLGSLPRRRWRSLIGLAIAKLSLYGIWALSSSTFEGAIADYGLSMLGVVLLLLISPLGRKVKGWMLSGIVLSFVAIGVQVAQLRIAPWLLPNDLYHVVQMAALYCFFRGVRSMAARSSNSASGTPQEHSKIGRS